MFNFSLSLFVLKISMTIITKISFYFSYRTIFNTRKFKTERSFLFIEIKIYNVGFVTDKVISEYVAKQR